MNTTKNDQAHCPSRGRLFLVWTAYLMMGLFAVGCIIFAFEHLRGQLSHDWLFWLVVTCLLAGPLGGAILGAVLRLHRSGHDLFVNFVTMLGAALGSETGVLVGSYLLRLLLIAVGMLLGALVGDKVGRLFFTPSEKRNHGNGEAPGAAA